MAIGNMLKKFGEVRPQLCERADKQTNTQTGILTTVFFAPPPPRRNNLSVYRLIRRITHNFKALGMCSNCYVRRVQRGKSETRRKKRKCHNQELLRKPKMIRQVSNVRIQF